MVESSTISPSKCRRTSSGSRIFDQNPKRPWRVFFASCSTSTPSMGSTSSEESSTWSTKATQQQWCTPRRRQAVKLLLLLQKRRNQSSSTGALGSSTKASKSMSVSSCTTSITSSTTAHLKLMKPIRCTQLVKPGCKNSKINSISLNILVASLIRPNLVISDS